MYEKIKKLSILIVFVIANILTTQVFADACGVVVINKGSLNVRSKPIQITKVVSQVAKGSALRILGVSGAWYKVKLNNGKIGYGNVDYIKELTTRSPEKCGFVVTKKTPLNIRKAPSLNARRVAKAAKGSALRILELGEWCKVKLNNGKIGYASSDFIHQ